MAYRKMMEGDMVRITDGSDDHGVDGRVIQSTSSGAEIAYTSDKRGYTRKWFNTRNLVITRDSPDYVATAKQTTPKITKEIQMSVFKIGDKVRVTGSRLFASYVVGKEGEIYKIEDTVVYLRFPDGDTDYGYDSEVERVVPLEEKRTTLAEKLDALDALTAEIRAMVGLTPSGSAL